MVDDRRGQEAFQESEIKYRILFNSSADAIMITDIGKGFIAGNPAAIRMFACKDEKEFLAQSPASLSPEYQPDGKQSSVKAQEMMAIAVKNGSHFFGWTHKRIDGEEFPATVLLTRFELRAQMFLQATVRDITMQMAAEKAQAILAAIVESSDDAIIGKDLKGNVLTWNEGAEKIYGYSAGEMIGRDMSVLIPPDRPNELPDIYKKIAKGEHVSHFETVRMTKDGKRILVSLTISPVKDKALGVVGASAIARDITKGKASEIELKKKIEDLERFQKVTVDRELKMKELKARIAELESRLEVKP